MSTLHTPSYRDNGRSLLGSLPSAAEAAELFLEEAEAAAVEPAPGLTQATLAALARLVDAGKPMRLSMHAGGVLAELRVCRVEEEKPRERPQTEQAILAVLDMADNPLKGEAIARRAGKARLDAGFGRTLSRLVKSGVLVKVPGGYWLASRTQPASEQQQEGPP